jgi:hypothetical protein
MLVVGPTLADRIPLKDDLEFRGTALGAGDLPGSYQCVLVANTVANS